VAVVLGIMVDAIGIWADAVCIIVDGAEMPLMCVGIVVIGEDVAWAA